LPRFADSQSLNVKPIRTFRTVSEGVFSETQLLVLWDFLENRRFRRHCAVAEEVRTPLAPTSKSAYNTERLLLGDVP
jgi:hypothetical protein